jgi:hypothetical protein
MNNRNLRAGELKAMTVLPPLKYTEFYGMTAVRI